MLLCTITAEWGLQTASQQEGRVTDGPRYFRDCLIWHFLGHIIGGVGAGFDVFAFCFVVEASFHLHKCESWQADHVPPTNGACFLLQVWHNKLNRRREQTSSQTTGTVGRIWPALHSADRALQETPPSWYVVRSTSSSQRSSSDVVHVMFSAFLQLTDLNTNQTVWLVEQDEPQRLFLNRSAVAIASVTMTKMSDWS